MVGQRIGDINVFGAGLVSYSGGVRVGRPRVSGDTSCTDHMVAWRTRNNLRFSGLGGPASLFARNSAHPDNIILISSQTRTAARDLVNEFGHATCLNNPPTTAMPVGQFDGRRPPRDTVTSTRGDVTGQSLPSSPRCRGQCWQPWSTVGVALVAAKGDAVRCPLPRRSGSLSLGP